VWARSHLPSSHTPSDEFARLLGVNVLKAKGIVGQVTFSRSNPEVVKVVSDMLSAMFKKTPYPTSKITIITSYNAQKAAYLKMIHSFQEKTGISFDNLPRVATIDSMQGHESDIVVLDWVNGYGRQLGFLRDNRRINVALTRARASLIVFFHRDRFISYYGEDEVDRPEILTHWDYSVRRKLVIRVKEGH
jgi:superfamily I DNA and/or RNA helicase